MTDETGRLMGIGDFARACGLTPKALRLYDDLGLLPPAEVDAVTGYRRYAPGQLETARLVALLRLVGMPLARIQTVIGLPPARAAEELLTYWRQVEADTASRGRVVRGLLARLAEENSMTTTTDTLAAEVGLSHRQGARCSQQDAVLAGADLFVVADGFGGDDDLAGRVAEAFASEGLAAAAAMVPADGEAGTTLTAVRIDGATARLTHVGDARVHLVRDGRVDRLTRDHTMVAALLESGELTEEEARSHPRRSLLNRALTGADAADETTVEVAPGDRLVLTTDGVHAVLDSEVLDALLTAADTPQRVADAVADAVEDAGAPDNHTVLVADLRAAPLRT